MTPSHPMPKADPTALFNLSGRTVLITGGGGVLGSGLAHVLGAAGARVAICDIAPEKADAASASLESDGIETVALTMNALDRNSIRAAADEAERKLGEIDILLNAAGGNVPAATVTPAVDFFALDDSALRRVFELNFLAGAVLPSQVLGERMAKRDKPASIINVASMCCFRPLTRVVGYSAAKAAVANFTQWLAVYMARELHSKVRVNAIAPGFFLTEQNRYLLTDTDGKLTARGEAIIEHTPVGRFGEPDDLAGAVLWLASDASAFITGIVVPIDGGFAAYSGV
jgi:NAD(P)-dependent dehydrogenase (short-subunit alcohol dehydrogenase family)